jgi:hypothetical protein
MSVRADARSPAAKVPRARAADGRGRTIGSYFEAFAPVPEWDGLVYWPPDVFALASLVLDHTEAYRFVVAPPAGRSWPGAAHWSEDVRADARAWRDACDDAGPELPPLVRRSWDAVTRHRDTPLAAVRSGEAWEAASALLTLHALADEACEAVASSGRGAPARRFERRAWTLLQAHGSLARLSPTRVRIVPKGRFSTRGITIRSLSRHLALCYESVDVRWRRVDVDRTAETYTIVLVPWPLVVDARDFRPASPSLLANMDVDRFGFFEFAPARPLDVGRLDALLAAAGRAGDRVDAVVFPEAALAAGEVPELERVLERHGAGAVVAGVRHPAAPPAFGRSSLLFGLRTPAGWERYEQDKHHRWCLDAGQIRQYHLGRRLDPRKLWWEAIDIVERTLHVVDVGGPTIAPLVCEDLARLDEVADLVRRIGPTLVVALLLDGPQLSSRWPCRYASVVADDPGSAVLTLTAAGMAARSRPPGKPRSRVVAHWNTSGEGVRELALAPGAEAIVLSTAVEATTLWTADGRRHDDVPALRLAGVRQLRVSAARRAVAPA